MTLTATANYLVVTGFSLPFLGTAGTGVSIEMWVRSGSYSGFTSSSEGWTLFDTFSVTTGEPDTWAAGTLNSQFSLPQGQTMSVYLHSITEGHGIRYAGQGGAPPAMTYSDAELTLTSNSTMTGSVPFSGSVFTPRAFSGTVEYEVVPETSSLTLAGVGALLLARRRRRA